MPLYDSDLVTYNAEIGKVYDFDGATNYEIKQMYEFDGTTNYEIFSSELALFDYGNKRPDGWFGSVPRIWDEGNNGSYCWADGDTIGIHKGASQTFQSQAVWINSPVDLTPFSVIKVLTTNQVRPSNHWAERSMVAISAGRPYNGEYFGNYWQQPIPNPNYEHVYDISGLSGTHYVGLYYARNYDSSSDLVASCYRIILA